MIKHDARVFRFELDHAVVEASFLFGNHGFTPNEVAAFVDFYGKTEACLQNVILIGDVVTKMTECLFNSATVENVQAR